MPQEPQAWAGDAGPTDREAASHREVGEPRQHTESAIGRSSGEVAARLFELSSDLLGTADADGYFTSLNPAWERTLGFSRETLMAVPFIEFVHPDDREATIAEAEKLRLDGVATIDFENRYAVKDGGWRRLSWRTEISDGSYFFVARDISGGTGADPGGPASSADGAGDSAAAARVEQSFIWARKVSAAIEDCRIVFHAQPIVSLRGGPGGFELLCRMRDEEGRLILPPGFLPIAEGWGQIADIDLLAVAEAARQISRGHSVSVNMSATTVGQEGIVERIGERLAAAGADPSRLVLELTETALIRDADVAQRFAEAATELGCRIALDDFGTGFGGFTYLKRMRVDQLKIDVDFVRDLTESEASRHLVEAIVALAKAFDLDTVAEGVEDSATLALLREYGVDHVQGYLFAKPGPIADVMEQPHTGDGVARYL